MSLSADALSWRKSDKWIVDAVSATVSPGELVAIIGPNGAGKSSLLHLLAGGEVASRGGVRLAGRAIGDYSAAELAQRRAVLAQEQALVFPFTVRDVVAMGQFESASDAAIEHCLEWVSATALLNRQYLSLSGGERQRVHLARVLMQLHPRIQVNQPCYLFLDEPLNALDLRHQFALMQRLRELRSQGVAICCVIHDLLLAQRFADRVWVMQGGRLIADGGPAVISDALLEQVFELPIEHRKVMAGLLQAAPAAF